MSSAYMAFAALGLLWGTPYLFTHWAAAFISPTQIVLLRLIFGCLPVLAYALFSGALKRQHWRHAHHFIVMSLLASAFYYWAFAQGTVRLQSGIAGVLGGSIPLLTCLCGWLFWRQEPITRNTMTGVGLGWVGILLIARPWEGAQHSLDLIGVGYMLLGAFSLGTAFVYARRFLSPLGISPVALCTYQTLLATLWMGLVTDLEGITRITENLQATWGVIFGLGFLGTGVAYILYYFVVDQFGALKASSVTYIPPVIALLLGVLVADESIHVIDLVAAALILTGVLIQQIKPRTPQAHADSKASKPDIKKPLVQK